MGGLIDAIARSAGVESYAGGDGVCHCDEARASAYRAAWEIGEDLRDLGVHVVVTWEDNMVCLGLEHGHFCFYGADDGSFRVNGDRSAVSHDDLMDRIAAWLSRRPQAAP